MSLGPDNDRIDEGATRPGVSYRGQILRGVVAGVGCNAALTVPLALALPLVHPDNVAAAVSRLLLSLYMFIGYVGGRVAARAGLSHEDGRAQWVMALAVSALSFCVDQLVGYARAALRLDRFVHAEASTATMTLLEFGLILVASLLLLRFGFAMGTWAQAKREGRAIDDDDASVD